jgi:hypothetical protein
MGRERDRSLERNEIGEEGEEMRRKEKAKGWRKWREEKGRK